MRSGFAALVAAALVAPVFAQSGLYGQCGGIGWSGATTCVAGAACVYSNPYYSQCVPSTGSTTPASSTQTTTSKSTTSSTSATSTSTPTSGKTNYWFSFGDSYTDTGFSISGTQPAPGNPLGNPAYPGNTVTGGPTWIDASTTMYNKSLILTYNLAVSGSTVDANIVPPYGASTLVTQLAAFTSWNSATTRPWKAANAGQTLFSFWFGINDMDATFNQNINHAALNGDIMYRYFQLVQQLYNLGARNFLFINVPPVDRSPLMIGEGSAAAAAEATVIADYNTKLSAAVSAFQANHTGVSTYLFDAHSAFTTILNNPSKYGFTSVTAYGQTGDFWGNDLHPASPAQVLIGQQISQLLSGTVW